MLNLITDRFFNIRHKLDLTLFLRGILYYTGIKPPLPIELKNYVFKRNILQGDKASF